ncbi:MAG: hypothetical protein IAA73_10565 [Bacteroidetes bacterium]|uniref:Uncharacterized protein n=1 Tax=Candidatus Gallipaludibacter merdavium TaxID=2840839 RepID=A0A9D9HVT6_9BACT|nr:hypothetical protein [Candidatus Gallipaludibacter merdavium]
MNEEELMYDDDAAVDFIYDFLDKDDRKALTKDDIQYVLDVIYDFYESEGLIQDDTAEAACIDEEKMFEFITKAAKKDNIALTDDLIDQILEGEYQYGLSIGIYSEEE